MTHARIYAAIGLATALLVLPDPAVAQNRGGRQATGRAVARTAPPPRGVARTYGPGYNRPNYYRPYYRPYYAAYPRYYGPYLSGYGFGYPGWGVGFGYGYPGWGVSVGIGYPGHGYGYPAYGYGYGHGYGYGYGYGYPGYAYPGYVYATGGAYRPYGGVRIDVPQLDAEVHVDGYFAGVVNDYDGTFQQLNLEPGPHRLEIRAPGFSAVSFEVNIEPGRTITYRTSLRPAP